MNESENSTIPQWESSPSKESVEASEHYVPDVEPPVPTVAFFIAWALFSVLIYSYPPVDDSRQGTDFAGIVNALRAVANGAVLATFVFLSRRFAGDYVSFPRTAGHWLCLVCAVAVLLSYLDYLISELRLVGYTANAKLLWSCVSELPTFLKAIVMLSAGFAIARGNYWRTFFWIATCGILWLAALPPFFELSTIFGYAKIIDQFETFYAVAFFVMLAALALAVIFSLFDLANFRKYDWAHWLGVTALIVPPLVGAVQWYFGNADLSVW